MRFQAKNARRIRSEPVLSNPVNTDTEGVIESVRINKVSVLSGLVRENVGAIFPQGQSKLSVIRGVRIKRVSVK